MGPLAWLVVTASAYSMSSAASVSPTQKVVQLLQDMAAKGRAEKQSEQTRFAAYKQFCDDTSVAKQASIESAADSMEQLEADIQKSESDASTLAQEIAELDTSINKWAADKKEAEAIRAKEHSDFSVTHKDYLESLDALDRAIIVLKKQDYDREQASSLLQSVSLLARVPASAKRVISSFLSTDSELGVADPLAVSAPEASSYEFQSGGVVGMLENLKDKFDDEKNQLEKEEMNSRHAFEMMMQEITDSSAAAQNERSGKAKAKAQHEEDAAGAKGDLADTQATHAEDSQYLKDLVAQCETKSSDFEARQQLRTEELEALQKAIEILASGAVSGAAEQHLSLVQKQSFALRAVSLKMPIQKNVAAFLQGRAQKLDSRILAMVAQHVSDDPFGKVKSMIKGMITRLLEEANEEAEHKGWCDKEMQTNKQTREDKTEEVNTLQAQVDQLSADITQLAQEIADLTQAIAEIDSAVAQATEARTTESAKNKATVEDAQEAQTAVAQATSVLKDFYAKAGTATALVQGKGKQPEADSPETWDESYTGMQAGNGGVIGMLEVIASDFARLEAETSSSESTAAKAHERFLAESSKDKAVKSTDMDHKKKAKVTKEGDLNDTTKDLKGTEKELDAALFYYEKLKPSCVDAGVSYDDRVARREEEIESLREALRILSGDDLA